MRNLKPIFIFTFIMLFSGFLYAESSEQVEPEELVEPQKTEELSAVPPPLEPPIDTSEELPVNEIALSQEPEEEEINFDDFFFNAPDLVFEAPVFEPRSFNDVFPGISPSNRRRVMSNLGLRYSFEKDGEALINPAPDSGINILESYVMTKKPSHIIEALILIPYSKRELDMLDIYNALGYIKEIKDQTITYNDKKYQIFKETTRLESAKNRKPIADPEPVDMLPLSETMYVRFSDAYIGELYLRGDITFSLYGVTYAMTNFRDVNYSVFSIMKAERFSAVIYLEPVREGILIYSASGLYLPGFIANRLNLSSNINNRITILLSWIKEGLKRQENLRDKPSVPFAVN